MKKKGHVDIKKLSKRIINEVSKLDVDEKYEIGIFTAMLTKQLVDRGTLVEERLKKKTTQSKVRTLRERIIDLREKAFFRQSKSDLEVHSEISKNYPCVRTRVTTELIRLADKHDLRRTEKMENGKNVVAYAWP